MPQGRVRGAVPGFLWGVTGPYRLPHCPVPESPTFRALFLEEVSPLDAPSGVVWIGGGWVVGLNQVYLWRCGADGDALSLLHFSVGQADYGARVAVARS